ncbi:MAG: hypothetical protein ABL963_03515 [Longimicrobiales bacterium]
MHWSRSAALVALALALLPHVALSQIVVRDDVDGWGWLAVLRDRRAIVQLAYASSQSTEEGRLDDQLLEALRAQGMQRVTGQGEFDPAQPHVMAECTGTDWIPQGTPQVQMALHAEVSYWDQSRLAATEIYEVLSIGSAVPEAFSTEVYVQGCVRLLVGVLTRLGFDQG